MVSRVYPCQHPKAQLHGGQGGKVWWGMLGDPQGGGGIGGLQ